jgi:hypothetical protein
MFVKRLQDYTETYRVRGLLKCSTIIEHFKKYSLHGEKQLNFLIFSLVVKLLSEDLLDRKFKMLLVIELAYKANTHNLIKYKNKIDLFKQVWKDAPIPYEEIEARVCEMLGSTEPIQCTPDP